MLGETIKKSISEGKQLKDLRPEILKELDKNPRTIVVLDDDPTGTQTVHNVPVVTNWTAEVLEGEMAKSPLFFILTNSRSLQANDANKLAKLLGQRLGVLAQKLNKNLIVISRSDSTLRGHYPNEVVALKEGLGWNQSKELLAPAFFEGGRYTLQDVHYVQEGDSFIPAAETPFAKDNTFGYASSNLKEWIVEKTNGQTSVDKICSISVEKIRENTGDLDSLLLQPRSHFVLNATSPYDMQRVGLACLQSNQPIIYRTGASFVNAISGIQPKKFQIETLANNSGGLTIIGSYVPKTTAQLNYLKEHNQLPHYLEFVVDDLDSNCAFDSQVEDLTKEIDGLIEDRRDVVLYTSRKIKSGKTKEESLRIVNRVSSGLVSIVQGISKHPRYIVAKGGITSSDIAVKGLGVKRAMVAGQALDGVPVWLLDTNSKFPNMPYIVFPGNVGDQTALHQLIQNLS